MRKIYITAILSLLFLSTNYLIAEDGKCINCHTKFQDGYLLKSDSRGDIYRILEHPCSPLSKIREACFNTEMLIIKTQQIIDELHHKNRIEVDHLQKNFDIWIYKYRELIESKIYSLHDFQDASTLIRFNMQKVYKDAADYQVQIDKRVAFGVMVCCSLLLVIFFIQGFKNSAGPGHPSHKSHRVDAKTVGSILILLLLVQPLLSQTDSEITAPTQEKSYLDKLSDSIEPLKDVSERVFHFAHISKMIRADEPDKAFLLLIEGRKLWDSNQKKLDEEIIPFYEKPDETGWVESDKNRYEKIGAELGTICAPYALRELVLAELEFGLDGASEKCDALIEKIQAIDEFYTRYGELSVTAGLLAKKVLDKAISAAEKIEDPFFKTRAYANIAKNPGFMNSGSFAAKAVEIAKTVTDPRFRTEILLKIYIDLQNVLPKLDETSWSEIEAGFDIKGTPEVMAMWYSRLVELIAGYDNQKAKEIADKIETSFPEPYVAAQLVLYEKGLNINLSDAANEALKIEDDKIRDGFLAKIAGCIAKTDTKAAYDLVDKISNNFYKDKALSKVIVEEYRKSPEEASEKIDLVEDPYVSSKMKVEMARLLIDKGETEKTLEILVSAQSDAQKSMGIKPMRDVAMMYAKVDFAAALNSVRGLKDVNAKWNALIDLSSMIKQKDQNLANVLLQEAHDTLMSAPKISNGKKALGAVRIASKYPPDKIEAKKEIISKAVNLLVGK